MSPSDFNGGVRPSRDGGEDSPRKSDAGLFESSVDYDVSSGSEANEFDVIDGKTIAVRNSSSFKLKSILSNVSDELNAVTMNDVINGNDRENDLIVPEYIG